MPCRKTRCLLGRFVLVQRRRAKAMIMPSVTGTFFSIGSQRNDYAMARRAVSLSLSAVPCMRYPWIKKEDTHGYTRQSSLVARAGRVFGHLPGALPSPGGRGRLGALPDRAAHRIAQQEWRHYGGGRPRDS